MSNTITITNKERIQNKIRATGTIAFSGAYTAYASGGEILDFTKAVLPLGETLPNSTGPSFINLVSAQGYTYGVPESIPQATNPLQVVLKVSTASGTELSGNFPTDQVTFEADFPSLL